MVEFFRKLFATDFMPHGTCYRWDAAVLWLNVSSDVVIAAAYYAIPFLLFQFARKRRDIGFKWIFVAFGLFILACGTTHLTGAITAWDPIYRFEGVIKAITAMASVATFGMLIPMMPTLVSLPSPSELAKINRSLAAEILERKGAEEQVRRVNQELESRVEARTAQLAASEKRFRQLAEAMPQMVWVTGPDGTLQYVNRQWVDYTGTGLEQNAGWEWTRVLHPDDVERTIERWKHSLRTGEGYEFEYRMRGSGGAYRWFLARGTPVFGASGNIEQWFGTCTDIDDQRNASESLKRTLRNLQEEMDRRRQLEDQLIQAQKMEAVGRLAGGVAHDFNNLLTAILGYNELLQDHLEQGSEAWSFADEVQLAAARASDLTKQLLAFSRRQVSQPRVVDLNHLVKQMDRMLRRIIGEDIEFVTKLSPGLNAVRVDPVHIDQVVVNLAVNARDAMPHGGKLTVETANVELTADYVGRHIGVSAGPYVMLAVTDTGTGMDAATRSHLFEPFFTTKEQGKGTGLGLAIVYGIVKQAGGDILVYSEPGRGSTFKIYLPVTTEKGSHEDAGEAHARPTGSETILIVEDEDQVRRLARSMLERAGYRILEANSPEDALRLIREQERPIDLLLTDVVMPRMSGVELAGAALSRRPNIKVLYMSGYTETGVVQQRVLAPGTPFVQKPFTSATLFTAVREALRG